MRLQDLILVGAIIGLCGQLLAQPLDRLSTFKSSDQFVELLRHFEPEKQQNMYSRALGIEDFGEGGREALILPTKVASVTELWRNEDHALVFATARPATEASSSEVGVLIVLTHINDSWRFGTMRRYEAIGKDAKIDCEITSAGRKPAAKGQDATPAVLTFRLFRRARGVRVDELVPHVRWRKTVRLQVMAHHPLRV